MLTGQNCQDDDGGLVILMLRRVDIGVLTYQEAAHGDDGLLQLEYFLVF